MTEAFKNLKARIQKILASGSELRGDEANMAARREGYKLFVNYDRRTFRLVRNTQRGLLYTGD